MWACQRPGLWITTDGRATVTRTREGSLYSREWMWVAEVDGEWIANADTLNEAKRATAALRG